MINTDLVLYIFLPPLNIIENQAFAFWIRPFILHYSLIQLRRAHFRRGQHLDRNEKVASCLAFIDRAAHQEAGFIFQASSIQHNKGVVRKSGSARGHAGTEKAEEFFADRWDAQSEKGAGRAREGAGVNGRGHGLRGSERRAIATGDNVELVDVKVGLFGTGSATV